MGGHKNMACGKIIYPTKGDAAQALRGLKKAKKRKGSIYFCDECKAWHMTGGGIKLGNRKRKKSINFVDSQETTFSERDAKRQRRKRGLIHIKRY